MKIIFVLALVAFSNLSFAGLCSGPLLNTGARTSMPEALRLDPKDVHRNQFIIAEHARANHLPVFLISIPAGPSVPVVLLNRQTLKAWSPILEQSFGLNQSLHPDNKANHGWARLPGRVGGSFEGTAGKLLEDGPSESVLMDTFSPGQSGDQALHGTGYRWKWMTDYFKYRHEPRAGERDSFVHIEQAFSLTVAEQVKVWLYHLVKRSALVRIQYMFDQHNNDWIREQRRVLQQDWPFNRARYGEHCNNCRIGESANNHASEMRIRMAGLFNKDVNEIYSFSETHQFLDNAKKKLLYRDWRNGADLHPDLMNENYFIDLMNPHFKWGISREQKVDALSYLLATNVFEEVVQVKEKYRMSEDVGMNLDNPNISAFFIYSELADSPDNFVKAQFEFFGANGAGFSSKWPGLNPRPLR